MASAVVEQQSPTTLPPPILDFSDEFSDEVLTEGEQEGSCVTFSLP